MERWTALEWSIRCRYRPLLHCFSCCRSNALGPYVVSRFVFEVPFTCAIPLLSTIVYYMTGRQADRQLGWWVGR